MLNLNESDELSEYPSPSDPALFPARFGERSPLPRGDIPWLHLRPIPSTSMARQW